jgi:glutathione S-transferase
MLILYQAEWCPFSSAVREILTELGIPFVAHPVEPWPEQRNGLRERAGTDHIPVLETAGGEFCRGIGEILSYLETQPGSGFAAEHRQRYLDHREAREADAPGQLIKGTKLAPSRPSR